MLSKDAAAASPAEAGPTPISIPNPVSRGEVGQCGV